MRRSRNQCQKRNNGHNQTVRLTSARTPRRWKVSEQEPEPAVAKTEVAPAEHPVPQYESARGDTLQLYLREIGQVKLLTPEEELKLARRVKRRDKRARELMITANLRLVVKIARDYENLGLPLLDLINEGNIGLMKGVERFDPDKGAKLSTYAAWWIKQSIMSALANQSKTIRLPAHVVERLGKMRRVEMKLQDTLHREPTDQEIAQEVGLDARRIRRYREASRAPVSLDAPLGDDEPARISEVVADPNAAAPFERMLKENDAGLVREALATLNQREISVLMMRFGLDDETPKTLEEVGVHFRVSRERIRQIQDEALRKLRKKIEKRDTPLIESSALAA
ncbi:MAG TPA: sigma-70 family RNA polymerase sigma factor [Verrucomicrobiae bacterium]|nr:sigma-70 family RNA polymerase sigma factor [Verrucomicrobiae bacterium]